MKVFGIILGLFLLFTFLKNPKELGILILSIFTILLTFVFCSLIVDAIFLIFS
jgi:hypothetical protein